VATFDTGNLAWRTDAKVAPDGKVVVAVTGEPGGSPGTVIRFTEAVPSVLVAADGNTGGNGTASEGVGGGGSVVFRREAAYNFNTRIYFRTSGTAAAAVDYTGRLAPAIPTRNGPVVSPLLQFVDIPAGQTSVSVPLNVVDDAILENIESAAVTAQPSPNYVFTLRSPDGHGLVPADSATVSIYDNDGVKVSFRPVNDAPPAGYLADTGPAFASRGNGYSYGWDADNSANARDRNDPLTPSEQFDGFNQTQKNGADRKWEIAVPNGVYLVTLAAGDAGATDSDYRFNLEGALALSGKPSGNTRWYRSTTYVLVTDGRLTLTNGAGASNNKIDFIEVTAAPLGAVPGPVTGSVGVNLLPFPINQRPAPIGTIGNATAP